MKDKLYSKVGSTYYPKPREVKVTVNEAKGTYWRAWEESGRFYYEFDEGHLATKFKQVEITAEDFGLLKKGKISEKDLTTKYG